MSIEVEASVAFGALSNAARRIYPIICSEIARSGSDQAPVTVNRMIAELGLLSTARLAAAVRELSALGIFAVAEGARGGKQYARALGWKSITDPAEAKRIAAEARATKKRKKPKIRESVRSSKKRAVEVQPDAVEVEPEPRVRPVSLYQIPWPSERGMLLLAE